MPRQISERTLLALLGAVQFVNVLDFMMVMPLGPDFAKALAIPTSQLGLIGGSYTAAAAVAGLVAATFLDRFDRRRALGVAMFGLVIGTAAGAFATGLWSLIAARVVAGIFGGPATALSLSILADVVPPERRGRAIGAVMAAFSVASVLGLPAGLELARVGGWRLPFLAVAGLGAVVVIAALALMPPMRRHLEIARPQHDAGLAELVRRPVIFVSLAVTAAAMIGVFVIVPNLSAHLQLNLGYPREKLGLLYLVGGLVSFVAMRLGGSLVDRFGATGVTVGGTLAVVAALVLGLVPAVPLIPVMGFFVLFMVSGALRNVPFNALTSRVPQPHERARFMSLQSAVQHLAAAAGAFLSSMLLHELPDGHLEGMPGVAVLSIVLSAALPLPIWFIERRVRAREREAAIAVGMARAA